MKKFNINDCIYIQITDAGWAHLVNTVGENYIFHCIKAPHYKKTIDGETWYRLQAHSVFELLPSKDGSPLLFETNIMFDDDSLTNTK